MLKIEKNVISRMPTVCFYTVVSGEINYLLTYLLYMCIQFYCSIGSAVC